MTDFTLYVLVFIAAAFVGLSKSGLMVSLGAINVPLLAMAMPARDAAGALLPVMLAVDAVALVIYARNVDRKLLLILVPGCLMGTALGWALSAVVSEEAVRLAIGIVTLAFVIDAWLPLRSKLEGVPPSRGWGTLWGAIAGFTSFISHTGGPPYQIYVLPRKLTPQVFAGTAAVFFAINNAAKLVPYYFLGQLEVRNLELAAIMTPIALAALGIGYYLVKRISARLFYNLAYGLLLAFSLKLIWDGATGLLAGGVTPA